VLMMPQRSLRVAIVPSQMRRMVPSGHPRLSRDYATDGAGPAKSRRAPENRENGAKPGLQQGTAVAIVRPLS